MPVLRPGPTGIKRILFQAALWAMPFVFRVLRRFWPIPHAGKFFAVTRHDDVREVFATDGAFGVPYKLKLDVLMGGEPFFLGMSDGPQYRTSLAALRRVVQPDDLPSLAKTVEDSAERIVAQSGGRIEVVDTLVRRISFDYMLDYLGLRDAPDLRAWCTRLFEYQFISSDQPLLAEVRQIAPALRAHIDGEIARRRSQPDGRDDVLVRCLKLQASGEHSYDDVQIRTGLMGLLVGGPPQPAMVVPQALEQLLRRPAALRGAQLAARAGEDVALAGYILEAMRFDPLGPGLPRVALRDWTIAKGTRHEQPVPAGATVMAAFSSGMMDERRVPDPQDFNPSRLPHEYIHFGHGLHQCFGLHINRATLHLMLKPLLKRQNLRRVPGAAGNLKKNGLLAASLTVAFD